MKLLSRGYVRLGLTCGILALWMGLTDLSWAAIAHTLSELSLLPLLAAPALIVGNLAVGAIRWGFLTRAYGGEPFGFLATLHGYLVAGFYNTFLPANLGGDIMRANAAGRHFSKNATPFMMVVVERILGFAGLFLLAGSTAWASEHVPPWLSAGLLVAGASCSLLALYLAHWTRLLSHHLPSRFGLALSSLPPLVLRRHLWLALALSVFTQALFASGAFLLVEDIAAPDQSWAVFSAIPLALLSLYLPTIGGFGGREAAFAIGLGQYGVSEADSIAASLIFGCSQLVVALLGGLAHIVRRM